jgi:hypothetical protein
MPRHSIAFKHPHFRLVASSTLGLVAIASLFGHLTTCARNGRQTLSGLSWLVDFLIASGRGIESLFVAGGWIVVVAIVTFGFLGVDRKKAGPRQRALAAGILGAGVGLASVLCMTTGHFLCATVLAVGAGLLIVAGGPTRNHDGPAVGAWLLAISLGVGALLRFWSLAQYPRGFAQHAVEHLKDAIILYEGFLPSIVSLDLKSAVQFAPLLMTQHGPMGLVDALGFSVFGVGRVEASMTQGVVGCIAICVAYGLGTSLEGPRLGFLFSFLLAVCSWHIAFSRYGDAEHILPTLQLLLALLFTYRAARFGRIRDYVVAGLVVGLSWYVYATNVAVPIVVAVFLGYKVVVSKEYRKRDAVKLVYMALMFMMVTWPHLSVGQDGRELGLVRTERGEFKPGAIRNAQTYKEVSKQLYVDVHDTWFSKPGGGLGAPAQTLAIVGAVVCLAGLFVPRRRDACALIMIWLAVSFLPAVLSQGVHFRRLLLVLVVALILSSVAILRILRLLEEGGVSWRATSILLALLCVVGTATSGHVYFEKVWVEECNIHVSHTDVAEFVSRNIGQGFFYIYASDELNRLMIEDFVRLFGYQRIEELRRQGKKERDLFLAVTPASLSLAIEDLRNGDRVVYLVSHRDDEEHSGLLEGVRSRIADDGRLFSRHGDVWIWESETAFFLGDSRWMGGKIRGIQGCP